MNAITTLTGVTLFALSAAAQAQSTDPSSSASPHQQSVTGTPGSMAPINPGAGSPADAASPHQKSTLGQKDAMGGAAFVTQASQAGMAEVELSKLAMNKASDAQVKSFANTMVQDHSKANMELKAIADKQGLAVSTSPDPEHVAKVHELSQKSGHAFDQAYVQQMRADHQVAVSLFQRESNDSNSELASFAAKTLPVLQHHDEMVEMLSKTQH